MRLRSQPTNSSQNENNQNVDGPPYLLSPLESPNPDVSQHHSLIPVGPDGLALIANSLCRGQEKRTMHEPEVQIGNSGPP
jgi:hypothetical protein